MPLDENTLNLICQCGETRKEHRSKTGYGDDHSGWCNNVSICGCSEFKGTGVVKGKFYNSGKDQLADMAENKPKQHNTLYETCDKCGMIHGEGGCI